MRVRTAIASTLLAALSGCAACDSVPDAAVTDCNAQVVPGGAATDILFVVDDSGSMAEEQDELANNLGAFIDQLLGSAIALDVHVGVTNTSVEDYLLNDGTTTLYPLRRWNGSQWVSTGFPGAPGTPYPQGTLVAIEQDPSGLGTAGHFLWGATYDDPTHLTSTWGGPRMLSSATATADVLARDFKANVKQGTWGSSREQPLAAMKRALEKASCPGPNCGFLRAGARLAVVVLTDEDDCSGPRDGVITGDGACHNAGNYGRLDPLSDFVTYLDTTVGGEPIVALIAGFDASNAVSLCRGAAFGTSTSASSLPTRLNAFLAALDAAHPGRTFKDSICQSFGPTLLGIAQMILPQTMPLQQAPADYRMMAVAVQRAGGGTVPCRMEPAGSGGAATADVVYTPAQGGALPSLTFQNGCTLGLGDRVDLRIVCVR